MHLSIVIPAFNEQDRIVDTLDHLTGYLSQQDYDWEIIVVDDGSSDATIETVENKNATNTRVIAYQPNRGKGHAVRTGMQKAIGDYRIFYDADASTPIDQVEKLWPLFDQDVDIVIGSRSMKESDVQIHQAWYRENMGRIYNVMLRMLALTTFPDTQCGFKGFTKYACDIVLPRQTIEGFAFDAELLYIAHIHKLNIGQVPVTWINSPHTTLNAGSDSAQMILETLRVRWNAILGRYQ